MLHLIKEVNKQSKKFLKEKSFESLKNLFLLNFYFSKAKSQKWEKGNTSEIYFKENVYNLLIRASGYFINFKESEILSLKLSI